MASIILWNLHFWTNNGWESACSHKSSWTTCRCFPGEAYLSNVPATQWKPGKARRAKDNCQRLEHAAAFLEAIQNAAQDSCDGVASRAFLCLCAGHRHATFPQKRPCKCGYRGFWIHMCLQYGCNWRAAKKVLSPHSCLRLVQRSANYRNSCFARISSQPNRHETCPAKPGGWWTWRSGGVSFCMSRWLTFFCVVKGAK